MDSTNAIIISDIGSEKKTCREGEWAEEGEELRDFWGEKGKSKKEEKQEGENFSEGKQEGEKEESREEEEQREKERRNIEKKLKGKSDLKWEVKLSGPYAVRITHCWGDV